MKTITYAQLWTVEHAKQEINHPDLVSKVFKQPEVVWLLEQGASYRFYNDLEYSQDVTQFNLEFQVDESTLTFLLLKWPRPYTILDYEH